MAIQYVKGDITRATENLILQGCNCFCTMGAGVARALSTKWPQVLAADRKTTRGDKEKLGTYSGARVGKNQYVLNCYTQYRYGRDRKHLDNEALSRVLAQIARKIGDREVSVAMPYLGCGLAGGNWETDVLPLVERHLGHLSVTVYHL